MKLTNDDLSTIIDCIDFVDDNMWEYCESHDLMNEETEEYLIDLRNRIVRVMELNAKYDMECG
tara:strand:- start:2232 stop:2420 length:189 start_codon:yes stop_codon:yes gene_type:complete